VAGVTWNGWQNSLIVDAQIPITDANKNLLGMMNSFAPQTCLNNPVGISHTAQGTTNCTKVTVTRYAQNYTSHSQAVSAFTAQLKSGNYPNLLDAFNSGDPFGVSNPDKVAADLVNWETGVGDAYLSAVGESSAAVGTPAGVHKGWADVRRTINHNAPASLDKSDKAIAAALRHLNHARKVKL
jgi:hypothetical protein